VVSANHVRFPVTCEKYQSQWSALVDPASNRYIGLSDGKVYADESAFVSAMRALQSFLAETQHTTH